MIRLAFVAAIWSLLSSAARAAADWQGTLEQGSTATPPGTVHVFIFPNHSSLDMVRPELVMAGDATFPIVVGLVAAVLASLYVYRKKS